MALQITQNTVVTNTHEYRMDSPANHCDIRLALDLAESAMREAGLDPSYDDAIKIEARDDEVVVFWVEKHAAK